MIAVLGGISTCCRFIHIFSVTFVQILGRSLVCILLVGDKYLSEPCNFMCVTDVQIDNVRVINEKCDNFDVCDITHLI